MSRAELTVVGSGEDVQRAHDNALGHQLLQVRERCRVYRRHGGIRKQQNEVTSLAAEGRSGGMSGAWKG